MNDAQTELLQQALDFARSAETEMIKQAKQAVSHIEAYPNKQPDEFAGIATTWLYHLETALIMIRHNLEQIQKQEKTQSL